MNDRRTPELEKFWNDPGEPVSKEERLKYAFVTLWIPVLIDPSLSLAAKLVYALLKTRDFNPKWNGPRLSESLMASLLGVSLDSIKMAVAELRTARLVHIGKVRREAGINNEYHLPDIESVYGKAVCTKFMNGKGLPIWNTADDVANMQREFKVGIAALLEDSKAKFTNENGGSRLSLVKRPTDQK